MVAAIRRADQNFDSLVLMVTLVPFVMSFGASLLDAQQLVNEEPAFARVCKDQNVVNAPSLRWGHKIHIANLHRWPNRKSEISWGNG
jgi:hypothetical protein